MCPQVISEASVQTVEAPVKAKAPAKAKTPAKVTPVVAPKAEKVEKKVPAKKAPVEKAPAKKVEKKVPAKKSPVDRSMADVPVTERRAALVKMLRKFDATSSAKAAAVEILADKLRYTKFDVYGLLSGTSGKVGSAPNCLLATGHVAVADSMDGARGRGYYLTAKGKKTDFSDVPFVKAPAKAKSPKAEKAPAKKAPKAAVVA